MLLKYPLIIYIIRLSNKVGDFMDKNQENNFPYYGLFFSFDNKLITTENYKRCINPDTLTVEQYKDLPSFIEHRDMWDSFMRINYPNECDRFDDDHKAMPRGRIEFLKTESSKGNPHFRITLCPCLDNPTMQNKIISEFNLEKYNYEFSHSMLSYRCIDCRKHI